MSNKNGSKETRTIGQSEYERRKGVNSFFSTDESFVSVFEAVLPEIEQFIGKEETARMLLEATAKDGFSVFSSSQLEYVGVLVEPLCKSLMILHNAQLLWDNMLGRITSELDVNYNLELDEDDDG